MTLFRRLHEANRADNEGGGAPDSGATNDAADVSRETLPPIEDTIRNTLHELQAKGQNLDEDDTDGKAPTQRSRAPDGKFAKPQAPTDQKPAPVDGDKPAEQAAQQPPTDAYPKSWKPGIEEDWKNASPKMREEIHRREQNFLDGIKQYREPAAFGTAIGQHMLPHVDVMRAVGVTPQDLTRDLMTTWSTLVRGTPEQKASTLLQVARQYGIDVTQLANPGNPGSPSQGAPATTDDDVRQRLNQLEQSRQAEAQERAQLQAQEANREIEAFGKDPAHEHFESVRADMAALIASGSVQTLKEAYDKAVWANPETRAKLLAKQGEEERKRQAAEAAAARKAAATNVSRRGTPPAMTKPGTMEDTIRTTYRSLVGSG